MSKAFEFARRWPAHIATVVVTVLVLVILSLPDVSATESAALNRSIDLLMRLANLLAGTVAGYWLSRWWLSDLYRARASGALSAQSLLWFEALRATFVLAGIVGISLSIRP